MSVPARDSIGAIKRTGEMMLSGWKLLATVCPVCATALLSKGDQLRCPSCDLPVMVEGDSRVSTNHNKATIPAPAKNDADSKSVKHYAGETDVPTSLEELKKEYDAKNKKKNTVSSKLGEKMLSGYALLGATCPLSDCAGTPLMSLKNGPMICVSCDKEYQYSEYDEIVPIVKLADKMAEFAEAKSALTSATRTTASVAAPVPTAATQSATKTAEQLELERIEAEYEGFDFDSIPTLGVRAFAVDPNDTSTKISQKLMKGWALLDEVCPVASCQVPLMRNTEGVKVCVACGYEHNRHKNATTAATAATAATAVNVAKAASASAVKSSTVTVAHKGSSGISSTTNKQRNRSESDSESSRDLNALYDNDTDDDDSTNLDLAGEIGAGGGDDPVGDYIKQWKDRLLSMQGTSGRSSGSGGGVKIAKKVATASVATAPSKATSSGSGGVSALSGVSAVLYRKVKASAEALEKCESIDKSIRLTELIHKLVLTIQAIERAADGRGRVECNDDDAF